MSENGKATCPDQRPIKMLKLVDKSDISAIQIIFNQIYNTGEFPAKWFKSDSIPLYKKNNATKYKDHRLINFNKPYI